MPTPPARLARTATLLAAAALALQAASGLLFPGLYRDNAWVRAAFAANDLDALLLDVPVLLAAAAWAWRGSARARIVWIGTLYYVFYNDLFYLLGGAFNRAFLLYVAIAVSGSFALVAALLDTDAPALDAAASSRLARRPVAAVLLASGALLGVMWTGQCLVHLASGEVPRLVVDAGGITHGVAALDLTAVVPLYVLGGRWLWRAHPWGTTVAGALLVHGLLVTVDLLLTAPFQAAAGIPGAHALTPLWALMFVAFAAGAAALLRAVPGLQRAATTAARRRAVG